MDSPTESLFVNTINVSWLEFLFQRCEWLRPQKKYEIALEVPFLWNRTRHRSSGQWNISNIIRYNKLRNSKVARDTQHGTRTCPLGARRNRFTRGHTDKPLLAVTRNEEFASVLKGFNENSTVWVAQHGAGRTPRLHMRGTGELCVCVCVLRACARDVCRIPESHSVRAPLRYPWQGVVSDSF